MLSSDETTKPTAKWVLAISDGKKQTKGENVKSLRIITFNNEGNDKRVRATTTHFVLFIVEDGLNMAKDGEAIIYIPVYFAALGKFLHL